MTDSKRVTLTGVVRDMLYGRENDEVMTVDVSLLWSLVYAAEEAAIRAEGLDVERLALAAAAVWPNANERHVRARVDELAAEYARLTEADR